MTDHKHGAAVSLPIHSTQQSAAHVKLRDYRPRIVNTIHSIIHRIIHIAYHIEVMLDIIGGALYCMVRLVLFTWQL
jgi:hypothetical protein